MTGCKGGGEEVCNKKDDHRICVDDETKVVKYRCDCQEGYTEESGQCIAITPCDPNKCDTETTECVAVGTTDYYCKCKGGYKLKEGIEPNKNKQGCVEISTEPTVSPTPTVNPCAAKPCQNGGTCSPSGETYKCTCISGSTGDRCEICTVTCGDKAKCGFDAKMKIIFCKCPPEIPRFNLTDKTCEGVDKCPSKLLKGECQGRNEICKDGECRCADHYAYVNGTCTANFCEEIEPTCSGNQKCKELAQGKAICVCKDGFYEAGNGCEKPDKCALMKTKCSQKCDDGVCSCSEEFDLQSDKITCLPQKTSDPCTNSSKCSPGVCVKKDDAEKCFCPETTHVERDDACIDRCKADDLPRDACPGECISDAKLGWKCKCEDPYQQANDSIHCQRKMMCTEGRKDSVCAKRNARCVENPDETEGYECVCFDGYDKPEDAKEKDECVPICEIKENYQDCLDKNAVCSLDDNYEKTCECLPLLMKNDADHCVKADFSFTGNFTVPSRMYEGNPRKYSQRTKRSVAALDYFKLKKDFKQSLNTVYKEKYNGFTILGCRTDKDDFICSLELKFKEDPQTDNTLNAIAAPSVCVPLKDNNEYCTVYPNLIMRKPSKEIFKKSDPCEESVRSNLCGSGTQCLKSGNDFSCPCRPGFTTKGHYNPFEGSTISICDDINECLTPTKCPKNTKCKNSPGSYDCLCAAGYRNITNEIKTDGCIPVCEQNLCGNHGSCEQKGDNDYLCHCDGYFTGPYCNVTNKILDDAKKKGERNAAIVGGVLGVLLAAVLIVGYLYYRKNRKPVDDDDEYARHRERAVHSERARLELRQTQTDINLRSIDRRFARRSPERRQSGDYRQYRDGENEGIPRAHVQAQYSNSGKRPLPERKDEERLQHYSDDGGQQRPSSSRGQHRSLSRSSDPIPMDEKRLSMVQYRNRGYEDD